MKVANTVAAHSAPYFAYLHSIPDWRDGFDSYSA